MMTIQCRDLSVFLDVCAGLVERGLTFEADADRMTIKLTGGF